MEVGEFSARGKSGNRDYCSVKDCESRADKNLTLSFHYLPRPNVCFVNEVDIFGNSNKVDIFEAWINALKITNIGKKTKVCSLHFRRLIIFLQKLRIAEEN